MHLNLLDIAILVCCAGLLVVLSTGSLDRSRLWRATVTPLASIIGSGFMVSGPLLASIAGQYAILLMAALCGVGFAIGSAVRHNIRYLEPIVDKGHEHAPPFVRSTERFSSICLAVAYLISICFYIQLLSAFALRGAGVEGEYVGNSLATAILAFLGIVGLLRGFGHLEFLEKHAVALKLAVIAGLFVGLIGHNIWQIEQGSWHLSKLSHEIDLASVRIALGALLIVQGFETSRYLGHVYSCQERVRSMRLAQLLAIAIYLGFMALAAAFLDPSLPAKETAIIDYSAAVSPILPLLLIVGAIAAQFSAATADFVGSAGLVVDAFPRVKERWLYPAIAALVIALTWMTNVFEILTIASRCFAAYYMLQCLLALLAWRGTKTGRPDLAHSLLFALGAIASAATLLFGLPAH